MHNDPGDHPTARLINTCIPVARHARATHQYSVNPGSSPHDPAAAHAALAAVGFSIEDAQAELEAATALAARLGGASLLSTG